MKQLIFAQIPDGKGILFTFKTTQTPAAAVKSIKLAVSEWAQTTASGEEAAEDAGGCLNWGDLHQWHEAETLKRILKVHGIKKMRSEVLEPNEVVSHDEILII